MRPLEIIFVFPRPADPHTAKMEERWDPANILSSSVESSAARRVTFQLPLVRIWPEGGTPWEQKYWGAFHGKFWIWPYKGKTQKHGILSNWKLHFVCEILYFYLRRVFLSWVTGVCGTSSTSLSVQLPVRLVCWLYPCSTSYIQNLCSTPLHCSGAFNFTHTYPSASSEAV